MTTHYTVLELSEQASVAEIRRAYLRLVLLTHPDRTPDPAAHQRYLAVNEAYETLSDPIRRQRYDIALQASPTAYMPADEPHPDPALRRRGRRRPKATPRPPAVPLHLRYAAEFTRLVSRLKVVVAFSLLLVLVTGLDFVLPLREHRGTVLDLSYTVRRGKRSSRSYFAVSTLNTRFNVASTSKLDVGDVVSVYQTPWFGKVRRVTRPNGSAHGVELLAAPVEYFWALALAVLASAGAFFGRTWRLDHAFNVGLVNAGATVLLLLFLLFL